MKKTVFLLSFLSVFFHGYAQILKKSSSDSIGHTENLAIYQENIKCRLFLDKGISELKSGKYDSANKEFYKALECDSSFKSQAFIIKEIAVTDPKSAIKILDSLIFNSTLKSNSFRHWGLGYLAKCHGSLGEYKEAIFYLTESIDADSHRLPHKHTHQYLVEISKQFYLRGIYKEKLQDYGGALCDYNKSMCGSKVVHFTLDELYLRKAKCYLKINHYFHALHYLNKTIHISHRKQLIAEAYYYKGQCKHLLNNKNGACRNWSRAGELGVPEAYEMIKKYCQ
jgi:tetratricopeptide (TPR) repeat protein